MKRLYLGIGFLLFASPVFGQTDAEIEALFWRSVECSSRRQVQAYLEEFPNGRYVAEARACLAQQGHRVQQPPRRPDYPTVLEQQRLPTDREIEDVFWRSVECSSRRQVQAYLEEFPNGRYVAEARACLAQQGHRVQQPPRRPDRPTVTAQATDFNALVQMAEADCQGRTYRGPRHPSDHSRFHCVNAFFLECRRAQGDEYRQAHRQACAQLQAAGMQCPHC